MCQSKAEGGRRCFPHGLQRYERARAALAGVPDGADAGKHEAAARLYEVAVRQFAANPKGHEFLRDRLAVVEAGADSEGDDAGVLRAVLGSGWDGPTAGSIGEALATGRRLPTQRPRTVSPSPGGAGGREFAGSLAEALATGRPMAPEERGGRGQSRFGPETVLSSALRTGVRPDDAQEVGAGLSGLPTRYDDVTVAAGQESFLERWGRDPVVVSVRRDVRHHDGNGWSEYDPASGRFRALDVGLDWAGDTRWHGVVTTVNERTGEWAAMRAVADPSDGVWVIQHDLRY